MRIVLLQTGKTTEKYIAEGVADYFSRIVKFTGFEIITIPDLKNTGKMPVTEQVRREGKMLLQTLDKDDFMILLDRNGRKLSTLEFSRELEKFLMMPKKRMAFVIGGAWGVSDDVYGRANYVLSISEMTFSHQVVRLLFMEQLYRALTVIKGIPYHHE